RGGLDPRDYAALDAGAPPASVVSAPRNSKSAEAVIGRAKRKPWPISQPRSCSEASCSGSSIPSATTSRWRLAPSAMIAEVSDTFSPEPTNERALFTLSPGNPLRQLSDQYPV